MKDADQIAEEAAARATWEVIQAFEKNVPSFYDVWGEIIKEHIKAAIKKAYKQGRLDKAFEHAALVKGIAEATSEAQR